MKIRTKFILFVSIIHLTALLLSFFIFKNEKILFLASELLILLSIVFSWNIYNELIQPLKLLLRGKDAIADKDFNIKFVETGKYEMDELIKVYNQMIDQLRAERTQQQEQHFFLDKLINTSPTGIIIQDFEERIQHINPKALQLLKLNAAEALGNSEALTSHPVIKEILTLRTGESKTVMFNGYNTYKLQKSHFIDRGFNRHFIMIEELTAEILLAEKKVFGKVIRMMAHEVNNTIGPVNSIIGSALKQEQLWKDADSAALKDALEVAVNRNLNLSGFVRNFADVVRLPLPKMREVSVHELVISGSKLFEYKAREKRIEFLYEFSGPDFIVEADVVQMEQVIVNIIKNSIEAIGEEGKIIFCTDSNKRSLTIKDSGKGLEMISQGELFSPFFSTKRDGQGLGLTLVKEILISHGFQFSLEKGVDGMTWFWIGF